MKKGQITFATVVICCIFLAIWFYAWWATKSLLSPNSTEENKSDSLWEKQNKCASYYNVYKDKLSNFSYSELSVSYSSELDNCIASWVVTTDTDKDWISDYYEFDIVNASRGDQPLYRCTTAVLKQDDKCSLKKRKSLLYDLTYSDIDY